MPIVQKEKQLLYDMTTEMKVRVVTYLRR